MSTERVIVSTSQLFLSRFCLFQFNIECELTCFVNLFLFGFSVCFFGRGKEEGKRSTLGILYFLSRHLSFCKTFFLPPIRTQIQKIPFFYRWPLHTNTDRKTFPDGKVFFFFFFLPSVTFLFFITTG